MISLEITSTSNFMVADMRQLPSFGVCICVLIELCCVVLVYVKFIYRCSRLP